MRNNLVSTTESMATACNAMAWSIIDPNITPITEEEPKSIFFSKEDTAVSSSLGAFFYKQQRVSDSTQLRPDLEIETSLENQRLFGAKEQAHNEIEKANETRIALLARKYASSQTTPEESARLNILTEKIQQLMPSITDEDVAIMENLSLRLEEASGINNEMRLKYGLGKV